MMSVVVILSVLTIRRSGGFLGVARHRLAYLTTIFTLGGARQVPDIGIIHNRHTETTVPVCMH